MKTTILVAAFILGITWKAPAQLAWQWARLHTTEGESSAQDIAVDSLGHIYITGYFRGETNFGVFRLKSNGFQDLFVAKLNKSGQYIWAQRFGIDHTVDDYSGISHGISLTLDDSLNIYVNGSYNSAEKTVVLKYKNNGTLQWQKFLGEGYSWNEKGKTISVSGGDILAVSGNKVHLLNTAGAELSSIPMNVSCVTKGNYESFLVATAENITTLTAAEIYVEEGQNQIALKQTNQIAIPDGVERIYALTQKESSLYFTGRYNGDLTIAGKSFSGFNNILVVKLSASGAFQWAAEAGGDDWDEGRALVLTKDNRLFVTGSYRHVATFGGQTAGRMGMFFEIFVAEFDPAAGTLTDFIVAGGRADWDVGYGIAATPDGQLAVTGSAQDQYDGLNFGDILIKAPSGNTGIFVAKTSTAEIRASLSGQIFKNNEPTYSRARLFRFNDDETMKEVYNYQTDADGKFALTVTHKGKYLLKAQYNISKHISAYYDGGYKWDLAIPLEIVSDTTIQSLDVNLIKLAPLSGTKTISGMLRDENNNPKRFIDMLLVSMKDQPIDYTQTDTTGFYKFDSIPDGRYKILVDTAGIKMENFYTVNIGSTTPTVAYNHNDYLITAGRIRTAGMITALPDVEKGSSAIRIYPIPAKNEFYVDAPLHSESEWTIELIDPAGRIARAAKISTNEAFHISGLKEGFYLARIYTEQTVICKKILVVR